MRTLSDDFAFLTPFRLPVGLDEETATARRAAFDYQQQTFADRGWRSYVGSDSSAGSSSFNIAKAVNDAFSLCPEHIPVVFILGSDHVAPLPETVFDALARATTGPNWSIPFTRVEFLGKGATASVLRGEVSPYSPKLLLRTTSPFARGPVVVSRELFEATGGWDERFEGWGHEDVAYRRVLTLLAGRPVPPAEPRILRSLWHPISPHRGKNGNRRRYVNEYAPISSREEMEAYLADRGSFVR